MIALRRMISRAVLPFIGASVFLGALLATAPLSLVVRLLPLDAQGVSIERINGTIWKGQLGGVAVRDVRLGDIRLRVSPLSVFALAPHVELSAARGDVVGDGEVTASITRKIRLDNVRLRLAANAITSQRILGATPSGSVEITIAHAALSPAGCQEATGVISTDMLNEAAVRYSGAPFPISGRIECDAGNVVVALNGDGASGQADINLLIRPDRSYVINAVAKPADQELSSALLFFGFEQNNGSLVYGSTGVVEGVGI